ncbi:MAG TPA: hypothetical protein VGP26_05910 [Actinophytocola sp.]|nr:hypothetical protein [Actinophytocola sp.]
MARAATEARERDLHPVLDVVASDTAAAALYERIGWQLLATVEQEWSPDQRGPSAAIRRREKSYPSPGRGRFPAPQSVTWGCARRR